MATGSAVTAASPTLFNKWTLVCVAAAAGAAILLLPLARTHMAGWTEGTALSSASKLQDHPRRRQHQRRRQQQAPQPKFHEGQLVWYRQRDGGQTQAKVGERACLPARPRACIFAR
jgi:hypothetical protein